MLVLSRKVGGPQGADIILSHPDGTQIVIRLCETNYNAARIGVEAPKDWHISRPDAVRKPAAK